MARFSHHGTWVIALTFNGSEECMLFKDPFIYVSTIGGGEPLVRLKMPYPTNNGLGVGSGFVISAVHAPVYNMIRESLTVIVDGYQEPGTDVISFSGIVEYRGLHIGALQEYTSTFVPLPFHVEGDGWVRTLPGSRIIWVVSSGSNTNILCLVDENRDVVVLETGTANYSPSLFVSMKVNDQVDKDIHLCGKRCQDTTKDRYDILITNNAIQHHT